MTCLEVLILYLKESQTHTGTGGIKFINKLNMYFCPWRLILPDTVS